MPEAEEKQQELKHRLNEFLQNIQELKRVIQLRVDIHHLTKKVKTVTLKDWKWISPN